MNIWEESDERRIAAAQRRLAAELRETSAAMAGRVMPPVDAAPQPQADQRSSARP